MRQLHHEILQEYVEYKNNPSISYQTELFFYLTWTIYDHIQIR